MPSYQNARRALAVGVLLLGLVFLLFPEILIPVADIGRTIIAKSGNALPIIPLLIYLILFLNMRAFAWKVPEAPLLAPMDKQEAASLTLAGLCFTSLSLLLSFFKEEIKKGEIAPQKILLFFTIALGCFIASYLSLRYRTKNIFPLASEAFIDNGLWCILAGLWTFTNHTPGLEILPRVLTFFIVLYAFHVGLNSLFYIEYARRADGSPPAGETLAPAVKKA